MKISFFSNRINFAGDALDKYGLGGSESALINITTCLKRNFPNDEITVYNGNTKKEYHDYYGVVYKTIDEFKLDVRSFNQDAFICLRQVLPFSLPFIDSKLKILWSQDDMNEHDLIQLKNNSYSRENIDLIFAISEYAKNDIQNTFLEKEVLLQRNGYREDWISSKNNNNNKKPIAIHSSTPFRGLDVLANCWENIYNLCVKKNVTPTLIVCTGMSLYQQPEDDFKELYEFLKQLPGVSFIGSVNQRKLYDILSECKTMLYPNHFLETGCMAVLEALANNCWVVTTDLGALKEQVVDYKNGFLIKGDSRSEEYKKQFIDLSVNALCNQNLILDNEDLIFSWDEQAILMRKYISDRLF